jgi:hypothetical protein
MTFCHVKFAVMVAEVAGNLQELDLCDFQSYVFVFRVSLGSGSSEMNAHR